MTDERTRAGVTPESWLCVDCGQDTAPGVPGLSELTEQVRAAGSAVVEYHDGCEIYTLRDAVWQRAGAPRGCLCVGCVEARLGRRLRPKDFDRDNEFNGLPGTPRLMRRRKSPVWATEKSQPITEEDLGLSNSLWHALQNKNL